MGQRGLDKRVFFLLCIIVLSSGIVGYCLLTRGHNWGDDFAAYILQAQSLCTGNITVFIQDSRFTIQESSYPFGPVMVPWGFPILLAPIYSLYGLNILALKTVLSVCYMAFLFAFFFLARTRCTQWESLLLTAFMAYSAGFLAAQNEILSDLPFLLWSTVALTHIERYGDSESRSLPGVGTATFTGLAIFAATITRFNGLLLLGALGAAQLIRLRQRPRCWTLTSKRVLQLLLPYLVFCECYAIYSLVLPSLATGYADQLQGFSASTLLNNALYYVLLPGAFLQGFMIGGYALYAGLLSFAAFAVLQCRTANAPLAAYAAATLAIFVVFPHVQGPRYILPILPIFFLFAFQGMKAAAGCLRSNLQRVALIFVYAAWSMLTIASLETSLIAARANLLSGREESSGPFSPSASSMFSFIRSNTPADSIVVFFKPRAMRLLAGRQSFLSTNCSDLANGNYAVIDTTQGNYNQVSDSPAETCQASMSLTKVYSQGEFEIYELLAAH